MKFRPNQEIMKDLGGYLTKEQVQTILNNTTNDRDRLIFSLLYYGGRRITEILSLKPENILFNEYKIIIRVLKQKKNKPDKYIRVSIKRQVITDLKKYIDINKIGRGKPVFNITRQGVFSNLRKIGKKLNIEYVGTKRLHPHHFRHSFAIHWTQGKGDLVRLQRILGHSSLETTQFYQKFTEEDVDNEYRRIIE